MVHPRLRHIAFVLIISGAVGVAAASASECHQVRGHLVESLVTVGCNSPVNICTVAQLFGAIRGTAHFTASAVVSSATTAVLFVTGKTVIVDAQVAGQRGTLTVEDAAAFRTNDGGDLVDIQTITGGTGDLAGATGSLRVSGTFLLDTGSGSSTYEGVVCLP
jgi:hypothetical protein